MVKFSRAVTIDVRDQTRKLLRTAQTHCPWLPDAKALGQRSLRQLLRRPFENDFRALPLLRLAPGATYMDIGANRGQSIDAIRLCGDHPVVHAFEPNRILANRLERRFGRSDGVTVHNIGLGDEPGSFDLHVPTYRGYAFDGLASLDEGCARDWLAEQLYWFAEDRLDIETMRCSVLLVDDMRCEPAFMKIDVQGYEYQVLLGARETLAQDRPVLLIERPGAVVTTYLAGFDYEPYQYRGGALVPGHHDMMNTFFLPRDREELHGAGQR